MRVVEPWSVEVFEIYYLSARVVFMFSSNYYEYVYDLTLLRVTTRCWNVAMHHGCWSLEKKCVGRWLRCSQASTGILICASNSSASSMTSGSRSLLPSSSSTFCRFSIQSQCMSRLPTYMPHSCLRTHSVIVRPGGGPRVSYLRSAL